MKNPNWSIESPTINDKSNVEIVKLIPNSAPNIHYIEVDNSVSNNKQDINDINVINVNNTRAENKNNTYDTDKYNINDDNKSNVRLSVPGSLNQNFELLSSKRVAECTGGNHRNSLNSFITDHRQEQNPERERGREGEGQSGREREREKKSLGQGEGQFSVQPTATPVSGNSISENKEIDRNGSSNNNANSNSNNNNNNNYSNNNNDDKNDHDVRHVDRNGYYQNVRKTEGDEVNDKITRFLNKNLNMNIQTSNNLSESKITKGDHLKLENECNNNLTNGFNHVDENGSGNGRFKIRSEENDYTDSSSVPGKRSDLMKTIESKLLPTYGKSFNIPSSLNSSYSSYSSVLSNPNSNSNSISNSPIQSSSLSTGGSYLHSNGTSCSNSGSFISNSNRDSNSDINSNSNGNRSIRSDVNNSNNNTVKKHSLRKSVPGAKGGGNSSSVLSG